MAYHQSVSSEAPLEKDFSRHGNGSGDRTLRDGSYLDGDTEHGAALNRIRTAGSISISPELFEKLYLSPQNNVKGDLRKTFGNPTPIALIGFLISLSPLSCDLMGFRGAGGNGAASTGVFLFFGGVLMILGGFLEFILGNTFPSVVFSSFGAFWLSFAATLQPFYNAYGAYSPDPTAPGEGLATQGFNASFAWFQVFMGVLCFIYLICSIRTNVVFMVIFLSLVCAFGCLAGAFFQLGNAYGTTDKAAGAAHAAAAKRCVVAGGAFTFVTSAAGWWIFFAILLASVDFPFNLPVGDLSTMIKGASERKKAKENMA